MKKIISIILVLLLLTITSATSFASPSNEVDAIPTNSKVLVDGKEIAFEAYNINGNNYFKLRDIAMVLNGTSKQFEVGWLSEIRVISINAPSPYTPVGGELSPGDGLKKTALRTETEVSINECILGFDLYNINGNNYFKLRDLGFAFNFYVGWDADNNCVEIVSDLPHDSLETN